MCAAVSCYNFSRQRQIPSGPPEEPRAAETQRLVPRSGSQKRLGKGRRVCVSVASVTAVTEDVAIRQRVSELPKTMILHGLIVAGDSKTGYGFVTALRLTARVWAAPLCMVKYNAHE